MINPSNNHVSNEDTTSRAKVATMGDSDNNSNTKFVSSPYTTSDFPRRLSNKRNKGISFESQFEEIFMDTENRKRILELFDKKELTLTEKKHIDTVVQAFVSREFPNVVKEYGRTPTVKDLIHIGESRQGKDQPRYHPAEWVEVLGNDMKWRLRVITRVVKQASSDYNWKVESPAQDDNDGWVYTYQAGAEKNLPEHRLRAPQHGLQALFGLRPWLWQQWAMLKLEEKMRFQENHPDDFVILSAQCYAMQLWNEWLEHPRNQEFKSVFYDDRIGDFGRTQLLGHILYPFVLIDKLTTSDELWNLQDDPNVSVYTYQSLHGAYFHISFTVFLIQVTIPAILSYDITKTFVECSQYQAYVPQVRSVFFVK